MDGYRRGRGFDPRAQVPPGKHHASAFEGRFDQIHRQRDLRIRQIHLRNFHSQCLRPILREGGQRCQDGSGLRCDRRRLRRERRRPRCERRRPGRERRRPRRGWHGWGWLDGDARNDGLRRQTIAIAIARQGWSRGLGFDGTRDKRRRRRRDGWWRRVGWCAGRRCGHSYLRRGRRRRLKRRFGYHDPLPAPVKRSGDFRRHFQVFLPRIASQRIEIQSREDFVQRQYHGKRVIFLVNIEQSGRGVAQFAEGDFNDAQCQLRHDFSNCNRDARAAQVGVGQRQPGVQLRRQVSQDGLQRQFHFIDIFDWRRCGGCGTRRRFRLGRGKLWNGHRRRRCGLCHRSRRLGSVRSSFVLIKASQQFSQQPGKSCFYSIWHRTQLFPRTMNPQVGQFPAGSAPRAAGKHLPNPQTITRSRPGGRLSHRWTGCPQSGG